MHHYIFEVWHRAHSQSEMPSEAQTIKSEEASCGVLENSVQFRLALGQHVHVFYLDAIRVKI